MNSEQKAVIEAIRRHRRFSVSSHVNPEGDALGSALALASLLKRLGKRVVVANEGGIPESLSFFPPIARVLARPRLGFSPEVAVTVDVPASERTGSMQPLLRRAERVVNIDHHVSNQRFGDVNWVDPAASSTGEMIYRLFRAFRLTPTRGEALCLYVSIVSDTGSFRYITTTPRVHRIAAKLISLGLKPLQVSQDLYECHSASDLRFLGEVLRSLRQTPDGKAAWLEIPHRMLKGRRPGTEIMDELVNYPRSVRSAEAAFVLREDEPDGQIRVSLRSKGRVDVNVIAQGFGGGGHMAASGCTLQGTMAQARSRLLRAVRQALRKA